MTSLRLAKDEVAYLAAYLSRVVSWDERSAVRVQARAGVVGVFSAGTCLALKAFEYDVDLAGNEAEMVSIKVTARRL